MEGKQGRGGNRGGGGVNGGRRVVNWGRGGGFVVKNTKKNSKMKC